MKKFLLTLVAMAAAILLSACVNNFKQNYLPFIDTQTAPNLVLLTEGATPLINKSEDVQQEVAAAKARGYIIVGEAVFNSELQPIDNLIEQAKAVKATMVIYSAKYTDTQTESYTRYVPVDSTTISSGMYGDKSYQGISTTSGLVPIPEVTQVRNFDQRAVFLVKTRKK